MSIVDPPLIQTEFMVLFITNEASGNEVKEGELFQESILQKGVSIVIMEVWFDLVLSLLLSVTLGLSKYIGMLKD
jgi:hypothetical protein